VLTGLPSLLSATHGVSGGVAVWAHVGGFITGLVLVKLFANEDLVAWHRAHALRARRPSWLDA
jgi:membrane associated rhomboid family serine protease